MAEALYDERRPVRRDLAAYAGLFLAVAAATILAALAFQHWGGYQPCALCLDERKPYYIGIPVAAATLAAILWRAPRIALMPLFGVLFLIAAGSVGLGLYHAGVEWRFWEGPASCAPSVATASAAVMLDQLANAHAPSCTDAVWRFLGLSFAGWNAVISAGLAALATAGSWAALKGPIRRNRPYQGSSTASQYR